jgi:tRNA U55 pseudouridine synthase TruB
LKIFELKLTCGTGTYVRSLGRDIARKLGSDAVMTELVRTAIGPFRLEESCDLETLTDSANIASNLTAPSLAVAHWPTACPSDETLLHLEQGKQVNQSELTGLTSFPTRSVSVSEEPSTETELDFASVLDSEGRLRALIKRVSKYSWRADKCFLLSEQQVTSQPDA